MRDFVRNLSHALLSSAKIFGHAIGIIITGPPKINKRLPKYVRTYFVDTGPPSRKEVLVGRVENFRLTIKLNFAELARTSQ